jgi:hypothetical protein
MSAPSCRVFPQSPWHSSDIRHGMLAQRTFSRRELSDAYSHLPILQTQPFPVFLTRGQRYISWERGADVFEGELILFAPKEWNHSDGDSALFDRSLGS